MSNNDMSDEYYYRLRDEFAMAAIAGIMANKEGYAPQPAAKIAYKVADAMIEARRVK